MHFDTYQHIRKIYTVCKEYLKCIHMDTKEQRNEFNNTHSIIIIIEILGPGHTVKKLLVYYFYFYFF